MNVTFQHFFFKYLITTARDGTAEYVAWGHSTVVDPWGKIVNKANEGEETIVADLGNKINLKFIESIFVFK